MQTVPREGAGEAGADLWPYATLVAVAADDRGRPLLQLSRLAEHTKNLERCARVSLLLVEPGAPADPLAAERMTIVGACARVSDDAERDAARAAFRAAHPGSAETMEFADFDLWRIAVARVRWIAGFGRMGWVDATDYDAWSAGSRRS